MTAQIRVLYKDILTLLLKQAILSCLYALIRQPVFLFIFFVVCLPLFVLSCLCRLLPFWRIKINNNGNAKYFCVTNSKYRIVA